MSKAATVDLILQSKQRIVLPYSVVSPFNKRPGCYKLKLSLKIEPIIANYFIILHRYSTL